MSIQITLKLSPNANPHLYINQLKEFMKNDTYIHPMMERTLKLMKKMRSPFVRLATVKEIMFVPERYLHLERALEPSLTGYHRFDWAPEEIDNFNKDSKKFFEDILRMYEKLGYQFGERKDIDINEADRIIALTKGKEEE